MVLKVRLFPDVVVISNEKGEVVMRAGNTAPLRARVPTGVGYFQAVIDPASGSLEIGDSVVGPTW